MTIKRVYDGLAVFLAFALGWLAITATAQAEMVETITYYHNDLTGSPVAATDEQGNVIWRKEYSPYGEELNQEQQPDHRGFTGHVHDADLGLTYMQARYYDPILGRFLAVDPAAVNPEVPFSFNRYAYANNNPYKYVDPDGRVPILIPVVIFVGKEIAFEVIERQIGFTPPSLKNGGKFLLRKGFSEGTKKVAKAAKEEVKGTKNAPVHHICTNKNCKSTARGGPWTPRFGEIFKKAGLDLDDAVNKVAVPGHKGPHPEAYHSYIYKELLSATHGLKANSKAYQNAVTGTLNRIKTEATTVGSPVNKWLTKK